MRKVVTWSAVLLIAGCGSSDPASSPTEDAEVDGPGSSETSVPETSTPDTSEVRPTETGKPCDRNSDCASGLCVSVGGGQGRCSTSCKGSDDCTAGWACQPLIGQPTDVCQCTASAESCDRRDNDCDGIVDNDAAASASCNTTSGAGYACIGGACACKPENLCGSACVDKQTSHEHCGSCGNACAGPEVCTAGVCQCPNPSEKACGSACVDTWRDEANCGACGTVCGVSCEGGRCNDPVELSLSHICSCARFSGGRVKCWGACYTFELAISPTPKTLPDFTNVAEVEQKSIICVRLADATVKCWADPYAIGPAFRTPTAVPISDVSALSAASASVCAVLSDTTVKCWGSSNTTGELGDGTTTAHTTPAPVVGLTGVAQMASANQHHCARLTDGTVKCWGRNLEGELGDGTTTNRATATAVVGLTAVKHVAADRFRTCAVLGDGTVRCWGRNHGSTPQPVAGLTNVAQIAVGSGHLCARLTDATVRCVGGNNSGQLGDGTTTFRATPVAVPGFTCKDIVAAESHTCARREDNSVWCWGSNAQSQLGDGTTINRTSPTRVLF